MSTACSDCHPISKNIITSWKMMDVCRTKLGAVSGLLTECALPVLGGVYHVQRSASTKSSVEGRGRQFMSVKALAYTLGDWMWWEPKAMARILNKSTRCSALHSTAGLSRHFFPPEKDPQSQQDASSWDHECQSVPNPEKCCAVLLRHFCLGQHCRPLVSSLAQPIPPVEEVSLKRYQCWLWTIKQADGSVEEYFDSRASSTLSP